MPPQALRVTPNANGNAMILPARPSVTRYVSDLNARSHAKKLLAPSAPYTASVQSVPCAVPRTCARRRAALNARPCALQPNATLSAWLPSPSATPCAKRPNATGNARNPPPAPSPSVSSSARSRSARPRPSAANALRPLVPPLQRLRLLRCSRRRQILFHLSSSLWTT